MRSEAISNALFGVRCVRNVNIEDEDCGRIDNLINDLTNKLRWQRHVGSGTDVGLRGATDLQGGCKSRRELVILKKSCSLRFRTELS